MKRLKRRIIIETIFFAAAAALIFLWQHKYFIALGISLGVLTGIFNFLLLAGHIHKSASIGLQKIRPYFFLKYLIRYAIMGTVLFLCARVDYALFFGAASGLVLIYLVIFFDALIINAMKG